ncbi:hypothetical protein HAX54_052541 [Datura stramonium]|uniref:Uncharacterized protein n=1 Tax=Datura stramonium TaxID=4076 RepID=A0ABS8WR74_DATST|nr:hypothetical protein [Datura stramonium]
MADCLHATLLVTQYGLCGITSTQTTTGSRALVVHPCIVPVKGELKMEFLSKFEPLESCQDQKINKFKRDLAGVMAIKRDWSSAKKDDAVSRVINEVVGSFMVTDATRTNGDHHSHAGGYTLLGVGGASGAGGGYTPIGKDVRRQEDTPYILGRSQLLVPLRCLLMLVSASNATKI